MAIPRLPNLDPGVLAALRTYESSQEDDDSPRRPRPVYRQPLPADKQAGMSSGLLNHGLSGLQYVGSALDKPGRAVRGVLAGRLDEALSVTPFSDSLGLTDPNRAVSGRNLTDRYGLTRRGDKGWGSWGLGLGAEMLLDPLSYLTFGAKTALTPAGQVAKNAGMLRGVSRKQMLRGLDATESGLAAAGRTAGDIAHLRDQGKLIATPAAEAAATKIGVKLTPGAPLGGLVGVGLPFRPPSKVLGTGLLAQGLAGQLDRLGGFVTTGSALGRGVGALFNPEVGGAVGKVTQEGWRDAGVPAREALDAATQGTGFDLAASIHPLLKRWDERDVLSVLRSQAEGASHMPGVDPALIAAVDPIAAEIKKAGQKQMDEARAAGLRLRDLADPHAPDYVPRQAASAGDKNLQMRNRGQFQLESGANLSRQDALRNVPGGTTQLNSWSMDPRLSGASRTLDDAAAAAAIFSDMVSHYRNQFGVPDPDAAKALGEKAAEVGKFLKGLKDDYAHGANPSPFFEQNIVGVMGSRGQKHARTVSSAKAATQAAANAARPIGVLGPDAVPASKALRALGLTTYKADKAAGIPMAGSMVELWRALARQGAGPVDPFLMRPRKALRTALDQYGIPKAEFDEITKAHGKWTAPEEIKAPLRLWDSATNMFKNLTYPLWPGSHVRNAVTAGLNNLMAGTGLDAYRIQYGLMRGLSPDLSRLAGVIPPGLTPSEQANWLRKQQFGHGKVYTSQGLNAELPGPRVQPGIRITPEVPGTGRQGASGTFFGDVTNLIGKEGIVGTAKGAVEAAKANPLRPDRAAARAFEMQGVGKGQRDFPALEAGKKVGMNLEDYFRGANYLGNLMRGMDLAQAGREVNRLHFDYGSMTAAERNIMRRLFPFYTYARKNLPLQAQTLLTSPGTISAQLRPGNQQQVPDYMASSTSIPLGPEKGGRQQFIGGLGLPAEEALGRLKFRGGLPDISGTALAFASSLNPILKGPIEQFLDRQFHTGRKLSDLQAPGVVSAITEPLGEDNPQALAQFLANTPLTRFLTAADRLADKRQGLLPKLINLGTGLKFTDVDMNRARMFEKRDALADLLRGQDHIRTYTHFGPRPGEEALLSPSVLEQLQMHRQQEEEVRDFAAQFRRARQWGAR